MFYPEEIAYYVRHNRANQRPDRKPTQYLRRRKPLFSISYIWSQEVLSIVGCWRMVLIANASLMLFLECQVGCISSLIQLALEVQANSLLLFIRSVQGPPRTLKNGYLNPLKEQQKPSPMFCSLHKWLSEFVQYTRLLFREENSLAFQAKVKCMHVV